MFDFILLTILILQPSFSFFLLLIVILESPSYVSHVNYLNIPFICSSRLLMRHSSTNKIIVSQYKQQKWKFILKNISHNSNINIQLPCLIFGPHAIIIYHFVATSSC